MKRLVKLLGVVGILSASALLPSSASAKLFPCDWPGQCVAGFSSTACSCPQGTAHPGLSATCGNQSACRETC